MIYLDDNNNKIHKEKQGKIKSSNVQNRGIGKKKPKG